MTEPLPREPDTAPLVSPHDNSGLIWGYAFDGTGPATALNAEQAQAWLAAPPSSSGFIWLHFNLSHAHCLRWLQQYAALDEQYFEAMRDGLASTRIERMDDALLAVINDIDFDFHFESSDIHTMWIQASPQWVISARAHPLRSVDALRQQIRQGDTPESSPQLLERLLRAQADVLVRIVRDVTQRVDQIEDTMLSGRTHMRPRQLGVLRRLLVRLKRLLAPEPSAMFRLLQTPPQWMRDDDLHALRAASEEFSVFLRDMQSLEERIKLLQEEIAAGTNEDTNRSLYTLTMITVLALPVNMMAGLFGMNVGGIPLSQDPLGFWLLLGVIVVFSLIAALWLRNKRRNPPS
ncbi:transporter [Comamonas piscis]|uniref:transporter n=1 Tax=Comamonas piscis TaxID=1562974 RepID=UPI001EE3267E|nr:transporter [Comamonas piscis]WSO35577.1 transporter [Comamonas piscis]